MSTRGSIQPDQHSIGFFGFETDGGSNSPLWKDYRIFFASPQYQNSYREWKSTKRDFLEDEITRGYWVLLIFHVAPYGLKFSTNKTVRARPLFNEGSEFVGDWSLRDTDVGKILRIMTPLQSRIYLFARQRSRPPFHTGIAFLRGGDDPGYCRFIPVL